MQIEQLDDPRMGYKSGRVAPVILVLALVAGAAVDFKHFRLMTEIAVPVTAGVSAFASQLRGRKLRLAVLTSMAACAVMFGVLFGYLGRLLLHWLTSST